VADLFGFERHRGVCDGRIYRRRRRSMSQSKMRATTTIATLISRMIQHGMADMVALSRSAKVRAGSSLKPAAPGRPREGVT
jgi:hypothetical protein